MASERNFIESLINSGNGDMGFFLPFFLGLTASNPPQETQNQDTARDQSPHRIIFINPFTQGMVVVSRSSSNSSSSLSSSGFDSFLDDLISSKKGQPPASEASIDALPTVEIVKNGDEQCVVCLEELKEGEKAKEMPCEHRFHGECIGKWLRIHGSCPVCRYEMPIDEADDDEKKTSGSTEEGDGGRRRETWVWLTFGSSRGSVSGEDS